jgi:hypothetical protein
MFYTLQACACSVATMAALPPEDGGGGALEEAVVDANCGVVVVTLASRAASKACSSSRRRAMERTRALSLSSLLVGGMKGSHLVGDALL